MVLTDAYRFPFSLFVGSRNSPSECAVERTGNVVETMDSTIGRSVLKITGSVSANNYADFSGVNLLGKLVYIQLSLMKPAIATFHIEMVTTGDLSLRLTFSTLYEQPRFLGRSLRLPLPPRSGWSTIFFDIDQILELNCPAAENGTPWRVKAVKRIQLCSNMLVRDVITSNTPIDLRSLPKELAVIASAGMPWINISSRTPETLAIERSSSGPLSPEPDSMRQKFFADSPSVAPASGGRKKTGLTAPSPSGSVGGAMSASDLAVFQSTVHSAVAGSATPGHGQHTQQLQSVIQLEHVNSYTGGPAVLLYGGSMMALASGSLIVLIDLCSTDANRPATPSTGFWRYFHASTSGAGLGNSGGFQQTYLRGHASSIGIIEQSSDGLYLITCETCAGGKLFLWNLQDGRRVATVNPHVSNIVCASISDDNSQLVTVGGDASGRVQSIVWDIQCLMISSNSATSNADVLEAKRNMVIAKQLSDFPIQKIGFSPFQDKGLLSCGRENIRFWRIKKGHMPGRPVQLNEYSRGFVFTDFAFYADAGKSGSRDQQVAFVASCKGMLLRVDCIKEQVLCAYQLHSGAICSLAVGDGVVITGGEDSRLRVWPLQFNDFLMEAHHESAVTHINISGEGGKYLSVGTVSGTLGVLNVFEHSYRTILRSHVGCITSLSASSPLGDESLSLGEDGTIRLWDNLSGTQKFEFNSPEDQPLCGAYHPAQHVIACGFRSGAIRVFDVQTTSTIYERSVYSPIGAHNGGASVGSATSRVVCVCFSPIPTFVEDESSRARVKGLRLFALAVDGRLTVFDVDSGYQAIRSAIVCPATGPSAVRPPGHDNFDTTDRSLFMSLGAEGALLAVATSQALSSLVFVDTTDLTVVFKANAADALKKHGGINFHHTSAGFTGSVRYGVSYPTSSPYYQPSKNPDNDSSPEDHKDFASRKGAANFATTGTTFGQTDSVFAPGGKSDRPVIGLKFVSDPTGVGEYVVIFTTKHMVTIGLGESSQISSAISNRRAAKIANIPSTIFSSAQVTPSLAAECSFSESGVEENPLSPQDHRAVADVSTLSSLIRGAWENRSIKQLLGKCMQSNAAVGRSAPSHGAQTAQMTVTQPSHDVLCTLASFDPDRGLLYIATTFKPRIVLTGSSNDVATAMPYSSLKVIGVIVKRGSTFLCDAEGPSTYRLAVRLSPAQNYAYPAGGSSIPLSCITPCGASGRVVTASAEGILGMWRLQSDDSVQALRHQLQAPSPVWPYGKGDSAAAYGIGDQQPTSMAAVFDAEYNHDDSLDYTKPLLLVVQPVKKDELVSSVPVLEIDIASPLPAKLKRVNSAPLSKRSPSWNESVGKMGLKSAMSPGFSKSMSFQSPGFKKSVNGIAELGSPETKKAGLPRPNSTKKAATSIKPVGSGVNKKRSDSSAVETSTLGSAPDIFEDDSESVMSSPKKDNANGEYLSIAVHGIGLRPNGVEAPLKIQLMDLEREITEAIRSPMPNEAESALSSPVRGGIGSPIIKSPIARPTKAINPSLAVVSESKVSALDAIATGNTTFLQLEGVGQDKDEDVVSQMEQSFCYEDFHGGRYVGDVLSSAEKAVNREDFLNFSKVDIEGSVVNSSSPPADMLSVPAGVSELRCRTLSQRLTVAPQFSNEAHLLLTSNGSSISLQRTDGSPGVLLSKPSSTITSPMWPQKGVVRTVSVSPSGSLVAAVIDYYSPSLPSNLYPAELVVWCAGTAVEEHPAEDPLHWMCLGTVHLQTGAENRPTAGRSKLGWTHDDSLVLAVPVAGSDISKSNDSEFGVSIGVEKSRIGCLVSVTHWAETSVAHKSKENSAYVATRAKAAGGIDMPGIFAALPFFGETISGMHVASWSEQTFLVGGLVSSCRASTIRIIFWAGKKLCMFEVTCPGATSAGDVTTRPAYPTISLLWTDDTGNHGPLIGLSLGWPLDSVHSFFCQEDVMVKGKTVGQSRTAAVSMGLGEDSADYYSSLCMPVPVLATLNASGGLKFVRLRAFASTQTFYANIPAAHTSGSPRSMSLSASGNTLCISYASAIQVYSVTHHMKEGNPYNVILRFNYKVLLSFAPHYVSTLTSFRPRDTVVSQRVMEVDEQVGVTSASKGNHAQVEDILVAGVDGDIGVVSTLSRYQKKMAMFEDNAKAQSEQFFCMGSSPCPVAAAPHLAPHKASRSGLNCRTYLSIVTVPDASIVATITTGGALIISHADSGITLPFPDTVTPTNCSALAASKTLLAVGSNCGRVCIYEARSMKVVKIVFMPTSGNKNAFALATRISSLLFITGHEDAEFLAVTLGDGSVCVSSVPSLNRVRAGVDDDAVVEAGDRMLRRISSQHLAKSTNGTGGSEAVTSTGGQLYLCDCFDSPNTFGVIRGDVLDLFSVEAPVSVTKSVDIVGGLAGSGAPIVARIGKVRLIDGHCEDLKKGNPRSPSTLRVYDVHIRRVERKLIVTAISASARSLLQPSANADLWVTVGSAELQRWGRGMAEVDVNKVLNVAMTRRVALGLDYRQVISRSGGIRVNSHYSYFSRNICHVFTATGLLFLDLDVIYKNSQVCGSSGKEHNSILDISTVTRGHLDFSSLCGSDKESAIPGDGQRSLQESAVVAISRKVVTKTVAAPEGDESGYDSGLKEIILVDVEETAFVCRSYPSPVLLRARI